MMQLPMSEDEVLGLDVDVLKAATLLELRRLLMNGEQRGRWGLSGHVELQGRDERRMRKNVGNAGRTLLEVPQLASREQT